jgi:hypothetical protein
MGNNQPIKEASMIQNSFLNHLSDHQIVKKDTDP